MNRKEIAERIRASYLASPEFLNERNHEEIEHVIDYWKWKRQEEVKRDPLLEYEWTPACAFILRYGSMKRGY